MVLSSLRRGRTTAAIAVLSTAAACGGKDPYAPVAQFQTVAPTFILLPLAHAQAPYGSAIDLRSQLAVRPGLEVSTLNGLLVPNFDVAFDVDASGGLVLRQPKLVTAAQSVPRTGIQIVSTPFDSLGSAPGGTYQDSTPVPIKTGQTVVLQAQGVALVCALGSPLYAKLVVDSVVPAGLIYVRARIDPNCGFKSFGAGVPAS